MPEIVSNTNTTTSHLKLVAITTMLIDNIGALVLRFVIMKMSAEGASTEGLEILYSLLRGIGRIAFPLFIFMLLEGFYFTHSRAGYLLRLSIFAILSEIPFDMGFNYRGSGLGGIEWFGAATGDPSYLSVPEYTYQNVFFTLAMGFVLIWIMEQLLNLHMPDPIVTAEAIIRYGSCFAAIYLFYKVANTINCDYAGAGIMAIAMGYLVHRTGNKALAFVVVVLMLTVLSSITEVYAIVSLPLILCYHGDKGFNINKWFFYFFYPGHLLVLAIIRILVV